jgi:uncharacterized membrane protein YccF (DUF307 family)
MAAIGNVLWFILGGAVLALFWLIVSALFYITILGAPIGRACFEFAKLSAFPYGKEVIRDTELRGNSNVSGFAKVVRVILNIIWIPIGISTTIAYFALGLLYGITIIGIPIAVVYIRMGKFLIVPFGARVVSKKRAAAAEVANELERRGLTGT